MRAVRVTVICDELVRIEESPSGRFCDWPSLFAIHGPSGSGEHPARSVHTLGVDAVGRSIDTETARIRLRYTPDGRPLGPGNLSAMIRHAAPPPEVGAADGWVRWRPGARARHNMGGTAETLDGVRGPIDLGEGLLARDGWHVVDDSSSHLLIDQWAAPRAHHGLAGNTDWYLFGYGEDYHAALRALAMIAGRVPLPRRYALGSWYSRYWPYSSAEYRGIVGEFHAHGFGLDVLVLDMDWHKEGWTGWSWNRELLPDAEDLLAWLHEQGLAVTLNLHPADGVAPHEDRYGAFMEAVGRDPRERYVAPFDAADPVYMRAMFEQVHRPLEKPAEHGERGGVDFWWLDWQQQRDTRSMPGLTNLRWLNHLYFQHTGGGALGAKVREPLHTRRGLSFSRWAGWGDHRHPVHFSGDAHTGWAMLEFQVQFTAAAGNVGCFYWSHDIGGHFGPRLEEAATRWVQFGAVSPVLRLHSARSPVLDRRPWTYEERFTRAMRRAYELRCGLMPYLYTQARRSFDRTLPLVAPMYVDWATHDRAYDAPGQYMLGESLLAAPITSPGLGEMCVGVQRVWFPSDTGSRGAWYDLTSGERHEGGSEVIVAASIEHLPIFVKSGMPVGMQSVRPRMSGPLEDLIVRLFPGEPGNTCRGEVYEDDGESLAYLGEGWAVTPLVAEWIGDDRLVLTIGPARGRFAGQSDRREMKVELGAVAGATGATIDGHVAALEHDPLSLGGCIRLALGERDTRSAVRIEIAFERVDQGALREGLRRAAMREALGSGHAGAALAAGALPHALASAVLQCEATSDRRARLLAIGGGIGACAVRGAKTDGRDGEADTLRVVDSLGLIDDALVYVRVIDRIGTDERVAMERTVELTPGSNARVGAGVKLPDARLALPPIGRRATRLARCEFRLGGSSIMFDQVISTRLAPITTMLAAGPYAWDWRWSIGDRVEAPECADTQERRGSIPWIRARTGEKWATDLRATFDGKDGLGYAWTTLMSSRRQPVRLHIDAADKVEIFVNGAKVFSLNGFDSHEAALGYVDVELIAGANQVLVKASQGGGGWGFTLSAECEHGLSAMVPGVEPEQQACLGPA